jgi:L-asparaginase II
MSEVLTESLRGGVVDELHRGVIAVVSAEGALLHAVGDPRAKIAFWRSAAKPFQAIPFVASGAAERFGCSTDDIALVTASHGGEPLHVDRAAAMLARVGFTVDDLACGAALPLDPEAAHLLERSDTPPTALHNTCSANHIAMLALTELLGEPHGGYRFPEHPVQRANLETVGSFTGLDPDGIPLGLDGCGIPCYGTSVFHLALAYARLMTPEPWVEGPAATAADAVREAMLDHPYLVAGRLRFDTELMQAAPGRLLAKAGAGGVQCIGLRGGIGIAVKIEDGASVTAPGQPAGVAALEVLRLLGELDDATLGELARHARPAVETVAGERAGDVRPAFALV